MSATPPYKPEFGPDFNPDDYPLPDIDPARIYRIPTEAELRKRSENAEGRPTYTTQEVLEYAWNVREAERRRAERRAAGGAEG
ncbi:hypothetical protein [Alienimonas chondri]|uniref:Uncharacterized protein n=1 Tax=Alienimonas chondri TaxID=2681879 RepID=A0ABX1VG72_9PLAN|nr:hypothetical protein [Alienimonas chondri]NNJ26451.1 hypothetical protein [Alienimonas chondri]